MLFKIPVHKCPILFCQFLMLFHHNQPVLIHQRKQGSVIGRILQLAEFVSGLIHSLQLLYGCHAGNVLFFIACMHHIHQGCHTNHKEFIQIGRGNTQKLQAFHQRILLISGLTKHPLIKKQPAQFSVFITAGIICFFGFIMFFHKIILSPSASIPDSFRSIQKQFRYHPDIPKFLGALLFYNRCNAIYFFEKLCSMLKQAPFQSDIYRSIYSNHQFLLL